MQVLHFTAAAALRKKNIGIIFIAKGPIVQVAYVNSASQHCYGPCPSALCRNALSLLQHLAESDH